MVSYSEVGDICLYDRAIRSKACLGTGTQASRTEVIVCWGQRSTIVVSKLDDDLVSISEPHCHVKITRGSKYERVVSCKSTHMPNF